MKVNITRYRQKCTYWNSHPNSGWGNDIFHNCSSISEDTYDYTFEEDEECPYCHTAIPPFILLAAKMGVETSVNVIP